MTFCFCFLFGVLLASVSELKLDWVYIYFSLFILISSLVIFRKNKKLRFILVCVVLIFIGIGRYELAFSKNNVVEGENKFLAIVSAEPDIRSDGIRYIVQDKYNQNKYYLKSTLYPRYDYGDELEISCELNKPEASDDFRYDMYLVRLGVFAECQNANVEKISSGGGNIILRGIFSFKKVVSQKINSLWHEPYASFMAGLLYGYRGGLGELNDLFSQTGITHIVAISGYNITIIVSILITICVQLYIPRKKAFWLIVAGIVIFVLFTGASASVVRAGIMGIIVLLSKQMGRMSRISNVLLLTAVIMTLQNPLVLVWDAGFQLSFISTCGLVYLSPVLSIILRSHNDAMSAGRQEGSFKVKERGNTKKVGDLLKYCFERFLAVCGRLGMTETLSAIIATLPLILFQFGRLSIVAPIVNILVLWIIPYLMLIGFIATVFSFIFFPLGQVLAWVGLVGLKYIVFVVKWFSELPFAAIDFKISWWMMVILYGLIGYLVYKSKKDSRLRGNDV